MSRNYENGPEHYSGDFADERAREITVQDMGKIDIPVTSFGGEGGTSSDSVFDLEKIDYLRSYGIDAKGATHAQTFAAFMILAHLVVLKEVEKQGGNLVYSVQVANRSLSQVIDQTGKKVSIFGLNGETLTDVKARLGFVTDPAERVNVEEYDRILGSMLGFFELGERYTNLNLVNGDLVRTRPFFQI